MPTMPTREQLPAEYDAAIVTSINYGPSRTGHLGLPAKIGDFVFDASYRALGTPRCWRQAAVARRHETPPASSVAR